MVTVRFFASYRERLNTRQLQLTLPRPDCRVSELIAQLIATGGETWADVLGSDNLVVAVNQVVSSQQQLLHDGDEVAFYPPVTGG
jgi:molybdopterin synthase sulfur carrier subunit